MHHSHLFVYLSVCPEIQVPTANIVSLHQGTSRLSDDIFVPDMEGLMIGVRRFGNRQDEQYKAIEQGVKTTEARKTKRR
jgi:hypothetical protein